MCLYCVYVRFIGLRLATNLVTCCLKGFQGAVNNYTQTHIKTSKARTS